MRHNHDLAVAGRRVILNKLKLPEPVSESMLGSLATIPIPAWTNHTSAQIQAVRTTLRTERRFELPVFRFDATNVCLRISAQIYNSLDQYERLADAVNKLS